MKMRIAPLWLALAGVCLAWIPPAGAQMANDLTIGNPKAMALGNAVTADETGIDSVHYNPAALTRMKGRQATVKLLTGVMVPACRRRDDGKRQRRLCLAGAGYEHHHR